MITRRRGQKPVGNNSHTGVARTAPEQRTIQLDAQCPLASFTQADGVEVPGISLVYLVDQVSAGTREHLRFTAWILNGTPETLTGVELQLRSFTNDALDQLTYLTQPEPQELKGRTLGPRQSLRFPFSYITSPKDLEGDGLLISALQAELNFPATGRLYSECDAVVNARCRKVMPPR